MKTRFLSLALLVASPALASNIYIISSGDAPTDNAVANSLIAHGHTVTIGLDHTHFNGTVDLAPYQTLYFQNNAHWNAGPMPTAGQQQIVNWVNAGGRLVTSEWVVYYCYPNGMFGGLTNIAPATPTAAFGGHSTATYTRISGDPNINAGLPVSFTFPLVSYAGTEVYLQAKPAATTYFTTNNSPGAAALIGWQVGAGSVFSFTSTCGPAQVNDPNFGRLFSNVMDAPNGCGAADFNGDGDTGTDSDIAAFFACISGNCCSSCGSADFNGDGDLGTDADIESFFRVIAGGHC